MAAAPLFKEMAGLPLVIVAAIAVALGTGVAGEWCGGKPGDGSGSGPCRVEGPATPADQPQWLAGLQADRAATVKKIGQWPTRGLVAAAVPLPLPALLLRCVCV